VVTSSIENDDAAVRARQYWLPVTPAIAIPLTQKAGFVCPPSHLSAFYQAIEAFDAMIVVGWRAGEQHFLEKLQQSSSMHVPTMVIGHSDAENVLTALRARQISGPGLVSPNGFSAVMKTRDIEKFLESPYVFPFPT
jgi:hypothetical protein